MPLIRISLRSGTSPNYRSAIACEVYEALREAFNIPEHDFFATVSEHDGDQFFFNARYLGIERTNKLVYIQIAASAGRTVQQKQALYSSIARRLARNPGIRKEDVFINLIEVAKENWSFGNGEAQYVDKTPSPVLEPV